MRVVYLSLLAASAIHLSGCASAAPRSPLEPSQAALIEATCAKVMGLRKGEVHFDECVDSLTASLDHKLQDERTTRIYDECSRSGLKDGTPQFSTCVLDKQSAMAAQRSAPAQGKDGSTTVADAAIDFKGPLKSYWNMPPTEVENREKYSCAQLGLDPSTSSFNQCVAELDANLTYEPLR